MATGTLSRWTTSASWRKWTICARLPKCASLKNNMSRPRNGRVCTGNGKLYNHTPPHCVESITSLVRHRTHSHQRLSPATSFLLPIRFSYGCVSSTLADKLCYLIPIKYPTRTPMFVNNLDIPHSPPPRPPFVSKTASLSSRLLS
jgi:hypothetical protein